MTSARLTAIDASLAAAARPARAEAEQRYLRSELRHLGAGVPAVRAAVKAALGRAPLDHDEVVDLAEALWAEPVHERRLAAVEVLVARNQVLAPDDVPMVERFAREACTWALIDPLAANAIGPLVERAPAMGAVLDRWVADPDFWVRRTALLSLLVPLRNGAGDWDRFARYADALLDEREFSIAKAIGWILRDTGKRRPDLVFDWLLPRASRAGTVTIREAVKPMSAEQRAAVAAASASATSPSSLRRTRR